MITRAEIATLTPKGRTQLFDDLSGLLFRTQEDCATALEITRKTVQNWRKDDNVPLMALYALHSMCEAKLGAELENVANSLARAVVILDRLLTSPAAQPGTPGNAGTTVSVSPKGGASR